MKKKETVTESNKKINPLKFFRNKRGQGMLEYVLLLGIIVAMVVIFKDRFTGMVNSALGKVSTQADSAIGQ